MAITIDNETELYNVEFSEASTPWVVKIDTGIAVAVTTDSDSGEIIGKVVDATGGSIDLGAEQQLSSATSSVDDVIEWPGVNSRFILCAEDLSSVSVFAQAVTRSGDTLTEQTAEELDANFSTSFVAGIATSGSPIFAAHTDQGGNDKFTRATIFGTIITSDTPSAAGTGFGTAQAMVGLNLTDFMFCFLDTNDLKFQIIVASSSSYTEGTIDDSTENASSAKLARLDSDKCLCAFVDSDDNDLKLMTVNRSGIGILGYGTPLSVGAFSIYSLGRISSSKVLLAWVDSGDLKAQTYSISGDTITADGNTGSLAPSSTINSLRDLAVVDTDIAVIGWRDSPDAAYVARLSGFSTFPDELRYLGLSADTANLYLTGSQDGTGALYTYELETLTKSATDTFGAIAYSELDAGTKDLQPAAKPATDGIIYAWGRDGSSKQLQYNDANGTLGWQDVGAGTATWGTADVAVGFMPDPLKPEDVLICFDNDNVYRSETGTSAWEKAGDATTGMRAAAMFPTAGGQFLAAGTAGGTSFYSHNYGTTFFDTGDTIVGTINWIEPVAIDG